MIILKVTKNADSGLLQSSYVFVENNYIPSTYNGNIFPADNYLFKITNRNTKPGCEQQ